MDQQSATEKYKYLSKIFKNKVDIIHGAMSKEEKDKVLNKFNDREIDILVSTTVIEVGIDFPNANVIVIENSNKYGLSQLHQLRGRVGRGNKESSCILMFKAGLSENARKRITILKNTNDGFKIAEEDLKDNQKRMLDVDNPLVVPEGTRIKFLVTGNDVMHSFIVPSLALQVYSIAGRINEIWTEVPVGKKKYYGQCNQICGVNHAYMPIVVKVISQENFEKWLANASEEFASLDSEIMLAKAD